MLLVLIGSVGEMILGGALCVIGVLSLAYNKRAAEQYAQNWGRTLKNGYAVGRFVSISGGIFFLLLGFLFIFVPHN
jgi:uncharacterized membrane protein